MFAAAGATEAAGAALKFAKQNPQLVEKAANVAMNVAVNSGGSVGALNKVVGDVIRKK